MDRQTILDRLNGEALGLRKKYGAKSLSVFGSMARGDDPGMRDWISHVYYRVDLDVVWDAVENKVPELVRALQSFKDKNHP